MASDDNSEFWLSSDESPSNSRLAAFVGKVCAVVLVPPPVPNQGCSARTVSIPCRVPRSPRAGSPRVPPGGPQRPVNHVPNPRLLFSYRKFSFSQVSLLQLSEAACSVHA